MVRRKEGSGGAKWRNKRHKQGRNIHIVHFNYSLSSHLTTVSVVYQDACCQQDNSIVQQCTSKPGKGWGGEGERGGEKRGKGVGRRGGKGWGGEGKGVGRGGGKGWGGEGESGGEGRGKGVGRGGGKGWGGRGKGVGRGGGKGWGGVGGKGKGWGGEERRVHIRILNGSHDP